MKRLLMILLFSTLLISHQVFALARFGKSDEVLTTTETDVVGKTIADSKDPLRDGTEIVAKGIGDADNNDKIYYQEITTTKEARQGTANFAKALINYALATIGLVALLYLMYHGFLVVTGGGKEDQTKKGREGMKYAAIALFGIGVAWFLLSLVFWLVNQIT